jgi:cysteine desulfurase
LKTPIYMDNHATTPVDPRVLEAMLPYFGERFGNPASRSHAFGWTAEAAVDLAREQVADLIGARAAEIVFTSGATEADNLAIKGAAAGNRARGDHLVVLATEHKAVVDSAAWLEGRGHRVTWLRPGPDGLVTPEQVAAEVTGDTVLVAVMHGNTEIGVVQPVAAIAAAVKAVNERCLVHCDAAQSAGRMPVEVTALGVDTLALSAHKMYGPKGVGALWVRRRPRVKLEPLLHGGGHERGLRSGTLPAPLLVGFGVASVMAAEELATEPARIAGMRDRLLAGLRDRAGGVRVNGSLEHRLPGNLNVSFEGVDGEALLLAMKDVAVSSGSACTSASLEPSYVLRAIGVADELAHASIRFGLGRFNTADEVDYAIDHVAAAVARLREIHAATSR